MNSYSSSFPRPPLNFPPSQVEKSLLLLLHHFRSGLPPALSLFLFPLFLPHTFLPRRNSIHLNLLLFNLPPTLPPHTLFCASPACHRTGGGRGRGDLFPYFLLRLPTTSLSLLFLLRLSLRTTEAAATVGRSVGEGGAGSIACRVRTGGERRRWGRGGGLPLLRLPLAFALGERGGGGGGEKPLSAARRGRRKEGR